jgi:hypothetical protein
MRDPMILEEVKQTLAALVERSPGRAIEVRIPPYAAVQCGDGPTHTGERTWADAMSAGDINASGARADLTEHLPIRIKP